jgi:hypothetical protein
MLHKVCRHLAGELASSQEHTGDVLSFGSANKYAPALHAFGHPARPANSGQSSSVDRAFIQRIRQQSKRLRVAVEGSPSDGSEGSEDREMPQSHPLLPSGQG